MKKQTYLVEELLDLTALKLDSAVRELGGSSEDIKKLLSALSVLRKFNGMSVHFNGRFTFSFLLLTVFVQFFTVCLLNFVFF